MARKELSALNLDKGDAASGDGGRDGIVAFHDGDAALQIPVPVVVAVRVPFTAVAQDADDGTGPAGGPHAFGRGQHADEVGTGGAADTPSQHGADVTHGGQAQRIRDFHHRIDAGGDETGFAMRTPDPLDA